MITLKKIKRLKQELNTIDDGEGFVCDDEDRAIINVGAENYDDIFSPYCYKGADTLSETLVDYLEQKSAAVPLDYDLTIRFHVKNATEAKRKEIQAAVKENYRSDVYGIERRMKGTTLFSFAFLLIGALITTIYLIFASQLPSAFGYLADILSWLFLWEGIDAFFLDRGVLRVERYRALRLGTAKIEIVEFEPY